MGLGKTYSTRYLADSNNNTGVAGQILMSTATGIDWTNATSVPGNDFWVANGNDIYNINSGNVGIGTDSPDSLLHIKGDDPVFIIQDISTGTADASSTLRLGESGAGGVLDVYWDIKQAADNSNTHLEINHSVNGNHLTILDGGNVGIGTTDPSRDFVVSNGGASGIEIQPNYQTGVNEILSFDRTVGATAYETMRFNGGDFEFQIGGSESMRIISNRNVGINETTPLYKLDVNGSVRSTHFRNRTIGTGTTAATAGWYKVASWTGSSKRGGSEIKLSTAGGSFTPTTWIIKCYKNWSYDATLKLEHYGPSTGYFTKARIVRDTTTDIVYVEIYQVVAYAVDVEMYQTSLMGLSSNITVTTGTLAAGTPTASATAIAELPFTSGGTSVEALTIGDSGNTGPYLPLTGGILTGNTNLTGPTKKLTLKLGAQLGFEDATPLGTINLYNDGAATSRLNIGGTMWVEEAGNVGIGTDSPNSKLTIGANGVTTLNPTAIITDTTNGGSLVLRGQSPILAFDKTGTGVPKILMDTGGLQFKTGTLDAEGDVDMVILPSGNVGIGTASPIGKLYVGPTWDTSSGGNLLYIKSTSVDNSSYDPQVANTSDLGITMVRDSATTTGPDTVGLTLYNDDGTAGGFSPMLLFSKLETPISQFKATMAGIYARSPLGTGNSNGWIDGELIFATAGAASQGIKQRMVINKEGNVGIGLTDPDSRLDINAGVLNVVTGPAVRISKGASPIGLIRYDTVVIEANDVATIRIGESDGTVSSIMSGDNNLRINSTDPIKFYTAGTTTGEAHAGQGGTFAMIIDNSQNVGIGTTTPKAKLDINGHFCVDSKSHTITDTFTTCLTVNLTDHTGCHVVITAFGDWGGHSSAAYRGEFFLQNGGSTSVYNEPGIILRQDDNTAISTGSPDQIICQIVDPTSTANPKDFLIQIRHTDTTSPASFVAQLTYTVQGKFNSIT